MYHFQIFNCSKMRIHNLKLVTSFLGHPEDTNNNVVLHFQAGCLALTLG